MQDIREAHRDIQSPREMEILGIDETEATSREIDHWISGDAEHTLGYYCGLSQDNFPPEKQFSKGEILQLCQAFEKMLVSWNIVLDIPEALPLNKRYDLMVGLLNEIFTPITTGTFIFDFCTGYAPGCKLGKYCKCLEYWKE